MAVEYVKKNPLTETMSLVDYMDKLAGDIGEKCFAIKQYSRDFNYGQLLLLLAGVYVDDDSNLLINRHFGQMRENEKFKLSFPPGGKVKYAGKTGNITTRANLEKPYLVKDDEEGPWKCRTTFPNVGQDALLYLSLMGGKFFLSLDVECQKPISINRAYNIARNDGRDLVCDSNDGQMVNDGTRLGALTTGAIVSASYRKGFQGSTFRDFFSSLLFELDMQKSANVHVRLDDNVDALLSSLAVPFLGLPNQEWPDFIMNTTLNVGKLVRAQNKEMCDASFLDGKISVLCKNSQGPFKDDDITRLLVRVRDSDSVVHLVVASKRLQNSVARSVMNKLGKMPDGLSHAYFYRIGVSKKTKTDDKGREYRDDLVPIPRMTNRCQGQCCNQATCTRVDNVIFFLGATPLQDIK